MSKNTQFGAELQLSGQDTAVDVKTKLQAAKAAVLELAEAFNAGETSQAEFSAAYKSLASDIRALEQANKILTAAEREAAEQTRASAAAAAQAAEESASEYRAMAEAKAQATQADLAHQSDLEAIAIQHETEMLAHEARQLAEVTAAEDAQVAAIGRWIAAENAAEREAAQLAAGLARQTAARSSLSAAEEHELASLAQSITAQNAAEAEAEQLAAAFLKEQNAIFAADGAMENFTADVSAAASAQGRMAGAAGNSAFRMGGLQQQVMAGSFAFQDFTSTSGDLGMKLNSITNNLPMLLAGMGGLGQIIAVTATAGVALYRNWDSIAGFWETRNPFPKGTDDIAGMKRELDKAKESLEKMEKAGTGNAEQIARYNGLRETTARLEKEIADQQERQARTKKFLGSVSDEEEGAAKGYQEATKGRGQEYLDKIEAAMRKDSEASIAAAEADFIRTTDRYNAEKHTDEEKAAYLLEASRRFQDFKRLERGQDFAQQAKDMNDRLLRGQENAFKALDRLMDGLGVNFDGLAERMKEKNPVLKKKADDAAEEELRSLNAESKAGEHAFDAQKRAANKDETAEERNLNAESKRNEKAYDAQVAAKNKDDTADKRANLSNLKKETAGIKAGGYEEEAAAALAQARAQGGMTDRTGRFHKMNEGQQFDAVQKQVDDLLKRRNPRMDAGQRSDTAMRITSMGRDDVRGKMDAAASQGLNAQMQTQSAVAATQDALSVFYGRLARVEQANRQLAANAAALSFRANEQGPTAQPMVGPH